MVRRFFLKPYFSGVGSMENKSIGRQIEKAIASDNWPRARSLIRAELRREPDNHLLLTCLGLTYYEQRQYKRALFYSEKALALSPRCPLVLWNYAGCLDMLERTTEALRIYRSLLRQGIERLAYGQCGEGKAWARGLVADCYYRIACIEKELGRFGDAKRAYLRHLSLRGPGCRSIYPIRDVRTEFQSLDTQIRQIRKRKR